MTFNFLRNVSDSATFFSNAGEAESEGIELEISGRPNEFFDYGLGIAHQNAEITSITAAEATMVGAQLGTPLTSRTYKFQVTFNSLIPRRVVMSCSGEWIFLHRLHAKWFPI